VTSLVASTTERIGAKPSARLAGSAGSNRGSVASACASSTTRMKNCSRMIGARGQRAGDHDLVAIIDRYPRPATRPNGTLPEFHRIDVDYCQTRPLYGRPGAVLIRTREPVKVRALADVTAAASIMQRINAVQKVSMADGNSAAAPIITAFVNQGSWHAIRSATALRPGAWVPRARTIVPRAALPQS
jgi:hypothetical protein